MKNNNIGKITQNSLENSGGGGNLTICDISQITSTSIDFFNYAKEVYSYLEDDVSKGIFEERLKYNIGIKSNLTPYLDGHLKSITENFNNYTVDLKIEDNIVIYGCSLESGVQFLNMLPFKENVVFCDRLYKTKPKVCGIRVISPNELLATHKNDKIILCVGEATKEVYNFLIENNVNKENIIIGATKNIDLQYFDDMIKFTKDEIFVDAGGFNGQTSVLFAQKNNSYKKIYIFEPDQSNISLIENNSDFNNLTNTTLVKKGCWNQKETLKFKADLFAGCSISDDGSIIVNCDSLDNMIKSEPVTFIKMDIEGAELNALKGAKNLITKYKPKLAISIYHKPEDIIDIPLYIKSLVPEYKLYIRHYSTSLTETVLYAVIDQT